MPKMGGEQPEITSRGVSHRETDPSTMACTPRTPGEENRKRLPGLFPEKMVDHPEITEREKTKTTNHEFFTSRDPSERKEVRSLMVAAFFAFSLVRRSVACAMAAASSVSSWQAEGPFGFGRGGIRRVGWNPTLGAFATWLWLSNQWLGGPPPKIRTNFSGLD